MFGGTGSSLVIDARFRLRPEPSEWGYNWEYAECSTPSPTPREGHGTLWMIANQSDDPVHDIKTFFRMAGSNLGSIKLLTEEADEEDTVKLTVINKRTKEPLLEGFVDTEHQDPNVGHFATFRTKTNEGLLLMMKINATSSYGHCAMLEHARVEQSVAEGYKLVVVSGHAPDEDEEKGLATRFTLFEGDQEIGRCLLSYRDGSYDPSMGPTIEMIQIRQDHRGKGFIKVLWHWVRCFIEENFTIECLNNDAPVGHVMVKATHLTLVEVDTTADGVSISDKDFFYNYCGFSVRAQKGFGQLMAGRRPIDEEAVLYLPLLSQKAIKGRTKKPPPGPSIGDASFVENIGARSCDCCLRIARGHSRCARCRDAYYCDRTCQKKDWKRHKLWCCRTAEEIHEELVRQGLRVKEEDGSWADVING